MVLEAIGIPVAYIGLIVAVDRLFSAVVLVIWAVLSGSYTREAIRLGRRGQKTE